MSKEKKFGIPQGYRLPLLLLLCIAVGSVLGVVFGEKIVWIKPIGTIFVNLMFTIAVPTVLFSITSSVATITSMSRLGKILKSTILIFVITGVIAGILMIGYMQIVPPGVGIENLVARSDAQVTEFSLGERIVSTLTVTDFPELFSKSHMLPLIIACLLIGGILSGMGEKAAPVIQILDVFSALCMKAVQMIMKYIAPIGLLAYFAALIAEVGPELLGTYAHVTLKIYYPMAILYFVISNVIFCGWAGGVEGIKTFFSKIFSVATTAFGTQSSLASLPGNMEAARQIGVPKDIRSVVLPLGATAHMDGAVMSNMLKIGMMFAMAGLPFTGIGNYASAIMLCVFCGVVTSAIPGAGMIGAVMIMSFYGFDMGFFPIIASLTFFVDPFTTCINCCGDCTASMMVTRIVEGKDWMHKNLTADEEE